MAEDISTLVVRVKSDGINDRTKELDNLTAAAGRAEEATKKLGTSVITGADGSAKASGSAKALSEANEAVTRSTKTLTEAMRIQNQQEQIELIAYRNRQKAYVDAATAAAAENKAIDKLSQAKKESIALAAQQKADADALSFAQATHKLRTDAIAAALKIKNQQEEIDLRLLREREKAYVRAAKEASAENKAIDKLNQAKREATDLVAKQLATVNALSFAKTTNKLKSDAEAAALRQKAIEQQRDIALHNEQGKAYARTQAEANKLNRELEKQTGRHGGNSAVIRENLVLIHELSQGQYKRFAGSLIVLAEYSNAIPRLIARVGTLGAALIGLGAGFVALTGLGIAAGAFQLNHFEKSLILTGNMAALTRDRLQGMANVLANQVTGGADNAKNVLKDLAETGKFTGDALFAVADAALKFAYLSGETSEKVIKLFDGMERGVAQWAAKANESYHFLTYEQYKHIQAMELQGDRQGAMVASANAMSEAFDAQGRKVGALVQWYREWSIAIDKMKSGLKSIGAGPTKGETLKRNIDIASSLQDQIKEEEGSKMLFGQTKAFEATKQARLAKLRSAFAEQKALILSSQKAIADEKLAADRKSEAAETTNQAIQADDQLRVRQLRNRSRREKMLDDLALDGSGRTRQNAAILQTQLAQQGLSYASLVADAKKRDGEVVATYKQSGVVRMNAQENEFKLQQELSKKYGIKLMTDAKQQLEAQAAIREEFKERGGPKGTDDRSVIRDTEVAAVKTKNKLITEEYESFIQLSKERANKEGADQRDELRNRDIATKGYLSKLQVNLAEELAILDRFSGKTKISIAANEKKKQEARAELTVTAAKLDKVGKKDAEDIAAREYQDQLKLMKAIEQTGKAEQKRLEDELLADTLRADSIGQLKSVALAASAEKYQAQLAEQEMMNISYRGIIALGNAGIVFDANEAAAAKRQLEFGEKNLTLIQKIIEAKGEQVKAQLEVEEQDRTTKNLDDALSAAKRFEKGLTDAFGKVGKAIGAVGVAFLQSEKDKDLAIIKRSKAAKDEVSQLKAQAEFEDEVRQATLGGYANMATAAAGFFAEGSRGYKTLTGVSQVFHAIEIAQTAQRLATLAVEAVLTQAKGDPYTAFARMAAMAGIVAALGYAVGGGFNRSGGGGQTAEEAQRTQGQGSVFGNVSAVSDSVDKSVEILKENSSLLLPLTSAMLKSLQNIEAATAGLGNLIVRTEGVQGGTNLGIQEGSVSNAPAKIVGGAIAGVIGKVVGLGFGPLGLVLGTALGSVVNKVLSGLFGKTTQKIVDSGIAISGSVADLKKGVGFSQFASIDTTKKKLFGLSSSTSNRVETQGLNSELSSQFALIFNNLEGALKLAATSLGTSGDAVVSAINGVVIDTKVSLKDLKGDDLTAALNGLISKASDEIAEAAFPNLGAFRQVGEGYAQTVVRVATSIEQAQVALKEFGITSVAYTEIVNKTGDVTREILAQSIAVKEGTSGVAQILELVSGSASDLVTVYRELVSARKAMQDTGLGSNLNLDTVTGAGGLDKLTDGLKTFSENFFTTEEKLKVQVSDVTNSFTALGRTLPESRDQLRGWIEAAAALGDQSMVGKLLVLTESYDKLAQATGANSATGVLKSVTALTLSFEALGTALPSSLTQLNALVDAAVAAGDGERVAGLNSLREAYVALGATSPDVGQLTASFQNLGKTLPSSVAQLNGWIVAAQAMGDDRLALGLTELGRVFGKLAEGVKSATTVFNQALGAVDLAFKQLQDSVAAEKTTLDAAFSAAQKKSNDDFAATNKALAAQNKFNTDKIAAQKAADTVLNAQEAEQRNTILRARLNAASAENKLESERNKVSMEGVSSTISSIQGIVTSVQSAIKATAATVAPEFARAAALATVKSASTSGDVTKLTGLEDAIKELSTPRDDLFSSLLDSQRGQAEANEALRSLEGAALGQLSDAEKQLEALRQVQAAIDAMAKSLGDTFTQTLTTSNVLAETTAKAAQDVEDARFKAAQEAAAAAHQEDISALTTRHTEHIARLDRSLVIAQSQIDAIRGVDNSVKSVQVALSAFAGAIQFAKTSSSAAGGGGGTGGQPLVPVENQGVLLPSVFPTPLPPPVTAGSGIKTAQEQLIAQLSAQTNSPSQNLINQFRLSQLPSFAVGSNELPEDMLAQVHKGERIIPAADNAELMRRLKSNEEGGKQISNEALMAKLDELIKVVMIGDTANVQKANELYRIIRDWEGSGLPPTREE